MVFGVTFTNRGANFNGTNLQLFSGYVEAWNSFHVRQWQFLILNIVMFLPLGILLPLVHYRFRLARWTVGVSLLFTGFIECVQLITGFGVFNVDDIVNNLVGAIIGFGLTMGIVTLVKTKKRMQSLLYFSPLIAVILIFGGMFTFYQMKEFGNLSIKPHEKINMEDVSTSMDVELSDQQTAVPVYKAPTYTKKAADSFVVDFFQKIQIDPTGMEISAYSDEIVYWVRSGPSYNVWFTLLDGSYKYSDFSTFDDEIEIGLEDIEEEHLLEKLRLFDIDIPEQASFQQEDVGTYNWVVDHYEIGDDLLDGAISVQYYNDDTIKEISNNLITYKKATEAQIKSEQEAYQQILDGKFKYYKFSDSDKVESVEIDQVELDYILDSKGFFQPIYRFEGRVNGDDTPILIPAI